LSHFDLSKPKNCTRGKKKLATNQNAQNQIQKIFFRNNVGVPYLSQQKLPEKDYIFEKIQTFAIFKNEIIQK